MKKTNYLFTLLIAGMMLWFASCQTSNSKLDGYKTTETGLMYKIHKKGDGEVSPKEGDFLDLIMVYGTSDSTLFDSRTLPTKQTMHVPMTASVFQGDIYEGLALMKVGDSATFALVSDSVWIKLFRMPSAPPGLDSLDYLYFTIVLNEILSEEEMQRRKEEEAMAARAEEQTAMDNYLRENYPDAIPSRTGLYYHRIQIGTGDQPVPGSMVKVHYTGYLLDGTKFDSSFDRGQPYEFPLGQGEVIKGWDEGISYMRKGETGVLIVPSSLGYGERGSRSIPPFSSLVFEVELVDFTPPE